MKKMYFIANLVAGRANISVKLGEIINKFNKADYEVTVHVTQCADDAAERAQYACENDFDLLVCAGGDGTLSQCLHGLMKSSKKIPVGYIPAGSTNDFARSLGIPSLPLDAADWIINGAPKDIDIGLFNDNFFTYIAAFGAFTNVTYETSQNVKNIFGHIAYLLNGVTQLHTLRSKKMHIEFDGQVMEDNYIFGMVSNTGSIAGLLSMNDFQLDDGLFEVMLIKMPSNLMQLQRIIHSLLNISEDIDRDYIRFFRTSDITFTSLGDARISWTLDGEFGGDAEVNRIRSLKQAIPFVLCETESVFSEPVVIE